MIRGPFLVVNVLRVIMKIIKFANSVYYHA